MESHKEIDEPNVVGLYADVTDSTDTIAEHFNDPSVGGYGRNRDLPTAVADAFVSTFGVVDLPYLSTQSRL